MPSGRKVFTTPIPVGSTFVYNDVVRGDNGVALDLTDPEVVTSLLFSLYNSADGVHVGSRLSQDALGTGNSAAGTLTFTGSVSDGETVLIGVDTYEFDTNASVVGGNLAVDVSGGATAPEAVTALVAKITASGTEPVSGVDGAGNTVVVTADDFGEAGNSIATTETCANASWGAATLVGGTGYPGTNNQNIDSNGNLFFKSTTGDTATSGTYVGRYIATILDAAAVIRTGIFEFQVTVVGLDAVT